MKFLQFNELQIQDYLKDNIVRLKLETPTPIQEAAIPYLLEGYDLLGQAPTGTGKTFTYAIPMLNKIPDNSGEVHAMIITPTRELAMQSADEIRKLLYKKEGISVIPLFGGAPIQRQILALKRKPNVVVGTPGRLLDHLNRHTLKLDNIDTLVIDECDELLDMGFIKDVKKIISFIKHEHQTVLFSATTNKEVKAVSREIQNSDLKSVKVEREKQNPIHQYLIKVKEEEKFDSLTQLLTELTFNSAFIFARTKRKVSKLQKQLTMLKIPCVCLHGDLRQGKRTLAMNSFKKKEVPILIATDIAARGIDISNVDIVINYDVPEQDEFYLHRIGRVGRADSLGSSYVFINRHQNHLVAIYEKMTSDKLTPYELGKKEGLTFMEKKILEKAQDYLNGDLSELESAISEKAKELNVSEITLAAALVKAAQVSQEEKKEEKSPRRESRHENIVFNKIDNTQRFFINIGEMDGIDKKDLMHFLIKYTPNLIEEDFADVYIKNTFSFFEVRDSFKDEIMEKVNNITYGSREVHVELSEKKADAGRKGPGAYKRNYDSVRKGDRRSDDHSSRGSSSRGGYAGRSSSRGESSSFGSTRGGRSSRSSSSGYAGRSSSHGGDDRRNSSSRGRSSFGSARGDSHSSHRFSKGKRTNSKND